jgi:hypothetical protein
MPQGWHDAVAARLGATNPDAFVYRRLDAMTAEYPPDPEAGQ